MGAHALRFIVTRDRLRKNQNGYDFSPIDAIVNQARAWGIQPQLVLDNRSGSGMGDPHKYAEFVKEATHHFKGRVGRYSLENEPDLRMAPQKYRLLYEVGRRAVMKNDPHAQILFGEFSPKDPIGYAKKVIGNKALTASGFAFHPYQNTDPLAPGTDPYWGAGQIGSTGRIGKQLSQLNIHTRAGKTPGMYFTEFGYGRYGDSNVDPSVAARFWPRALQKARSAGARQIIAYTMTAPNYATAPWDTGLLNADGSARPAYQALVQAVKRGALGR